MGPTSRLFEGWVREVVRDVAREHAPVYGESTGAGEKGARISVLSAVRFRKLGSEETYGADSVWLTVDTTVDSGFI
jgi:hypothetical protein